MTLSPLIRRIRLNIGFLFVRLRFRYPFLSPTPRDVNLGSRSGVRRQLRPLWTFTTDRRHARRTKKSGTKKMSARKSLDAGMPPMHHIDLIKTSEQNLSVLILNVLRHYVFHI